MTRPLKYSLIVLLLSFGLSAVSQLADSTDFVLEDIEINFISSYMEQDGEHAAVTGGVGSQRLTNTAPAIMMSVPVDAYHKLNMTLGVDVYTSASSDNINNPYPDRFHVSSASYKDIRAYTNLALSRKWKKNPTNTTTYKVGLSAEWDVVSYQAGLGFAKSFDNEQKHIGVDVSYFFDDWRLIYPVELRSNSPQLLDTDKRQTLMGSFFLSSIVSRRAQASLVFDVIYQQGLLSTPFHRVYHSDIQDLDLLPDIERLPSSRLKLPVGVKLNLFPSDRFIVKLNYRFYYDTWNMVGHTFDAEIPIIVSDAIRLYPNYRYHTQTAVSYFAGFQEHVRGESSFYTSDYDLSAFTSHQFGLGLGIYPVNGIFSIKGKNKKTVMKGLEFKYAYYDRSDGLTAFIGTLSAKFGIRQFK